MKTKKHENEEKINVMYSIQWNRMISLSHLSTYLVS